MPGRVVRCAAALGSGVSRSVPMNGSMTFAAESPSRRRADER